MSLNIINAFTDGNYSYYNFNIKFNHLFLKFIKFYINLYKYFHILEIYN